MKRFCKCGAEVTNDNIFNYDYDFDCHTYECKECNTFFTDDDCFVSNYDIGDKVILDNEQHTIKDIYLSDDYKIVLVLENDIEVTEDEID